MMKIEPYKIGIYFILIILSIIWLFPLVSMLTIVVKSPDEFIEMRFWELPKLKNIPANLASNFGHAWGKSRLGGKMFNSMIFALTAGIGSAFIASVGGYALVHLKVKSSQSWFIGIFIGNIFPFVFLIAVLYIISGILHLAGKTSYKNLAYAAAILNIIWYMVYMVLVQVELVPVLNALELFPKNMLGALVILGMIINAVFYCGYPIFLIIFVNRGGREWDTLDTGYKS